jgi:NADH:ubiquinone oxidoreductase subunit 6 (subunit J)
MVFVAGIYFLLAAPFIGAMQLMVYAGGISVLMIFAIMLVRRISGEPVEHITRQPGPAIVLGALFSGWSLYLTWMTFGPSATDAPNLAATPHSASVEEVADVLIQRYLIPFELASVLLLVAMVGAIALTVRAKQPAGPRVDNE